MQDVIDECLKEDQLEILKEDLEDLEYDHLGGQTTDELLKRYNTLTKEDVEKCRRNYLTCRKNIL